MSAYRGLRAGFSSSGEDLKQGEDLVVGEEATSSLMGRGYGEPTRHSTPAPSLSSGSRSCRVLAGLSAALVITLVALTVATGGEKHITRAAPHVGEAMSAGAGSAAPRYPKADAVEASSVCPPSPASVHCQCAIKFRVRDFGCRDVKEEVERRMHGWDGWVDPKSRPGSYRLLESTADTTKGTRTTGDGNAFVDYFTFKYIQEDELGGECTVVGCSASQVTSMYGELRTRTERARSEDLQTDAPPIPDFSTNFCNMRNLLAGTMSTPPVKICRHDIRSLSHDASLFTCPFHDESQCNR